MSNLYTRQETLSLNTSQTITVVGVGGIGFHVAKMLVMSGIERIFLYDPDVFEEHNFNRIDVPMSYIGRNKADVCAMALKALRPDAYVKYYPFKLNQDLYSKSDWLIDCTDKQESQDANQALADRNGAKYVKAGYDGTHISVSNRVAEWGEADDGYTITPSWVVPAIVGAAMVVAKVLKYSQKELSCDINHMFLVR